METIMAISLGADIKVSLTYRTKICKILCEQFGLKLVADDGSKPIHGWVHATQLLNDQLNVGAISLTVCLLGWERPKTLTIVGEIGRGLKEQIEDLVPAFFKELKFSLVQPSRDQMIEKVLAAFENLETLIVAYPDKSEDLDWYWAESELQQQLDCAGGQDKEGAVFFSPDDEQRFWEKGKLLIRFLAQRSAEDASVVGSSIVDALRCQGLSPRWEGDPDCCIELQASV
jgi:hypothetical protein